MERESFKEYSEAAIVEKEELYAMKSCFEELHTFLSMGGDIPSEPNTEQSVKEFSSSRGTLRQKKLHFSMGTYVDINS